MIVAAFRGGTEPGLQAVWHIFLGLSAFGLLEAQFVGPTALRATWGRFSLHFRRHPRAWPEDRAVRLRNGGLL